ncbi:MAG: peptidylprolyl isomerase [Clostridia bacterium]|nr:peptidylprolyl isomerase [Clostridia bacterium]
MKKLTLLMALLLAMCLVMSGCQKAAPVAAPTAEPAPMSTVTPTAEPAAETAPAVEVAASPASVNGVEIDPMTVANIAENLMYQYAQYGYDTTDANFIASVNQYAVEYAIQMEVMMQKAAELGLDKFTDEEMAALTAEAKAEWDELVAQYVAYYGGLTEESTEADKAAATESVIAMLAAMGATEAQWLEDTVTNAVLERVEAEMVKGAEVTDEEVKAAYDEHVASDEASYKTDVAMYEYMTQYYGQPSFYMPEGYRGITHILLKVDEALLTNYQTLTAQLEEQEEAAEAATPTDLAATPTDVTPVTQEQVDAAYQAILDSVKTTTDEIYAALEAGTPFAELIAKYNTDPGMSSEPYASEGYSVHKDSIIWDPAFVQGAFSVDNVGDVAQPVVGSYGVHIVCYFRDVPSGAVEFTEEVQASLRAELLSTKENDQFNATMTAWMEAAEIVYAVTPAEVETVETPAE